MSTHEAAISAAIAEHRGIVVRVARSFATNPQDQEDLIQEILLRIWAARQSFRGESKASTWMYRVALNRALTWQRDERSRRTKHHQLIELPDPSAAQAAESAHQLNELYDMLRTLPPLDRSLVLLSLDGFAYAEIADIVGISESNVGARLSRARSRLRASRDAEQAQSDDAQSPDPSTTPSSSATADATPAAHTPTNTERGAS